MPSTSKRSALKRSGSKTPARKTSERVRKNSASKPTSIDLADSIVGAWNTSNRVTIFLLRGLPAELWDAKIPGEPRRSIRMLAAHLHNCRSGWLRTLGAPHGLRVPKRVDRYKVKPRELTAALEVSGADMAALLRFGCEHAGIMPPTPKYAWRNLPLDVGHVLGYFVGHESHHRGQIVLLARQLGHRLPAEVTGGIWDWTKRSKEA
jgi:uncharacterized damage-inducible protein DinB